MMDTVGAMPQDNDDYDAPVTAKDMLAVLKQSDDPEVQRRIREGCIETAEADKADALRPWVNQILKAADIGIGAFISDESMMVDLMPFEDDDYQREVEAQLGVSFKLDDYIYEVAARLRDAQQALDN